nr:HAD hydrolase-like protein [uncultured Mogibacterium sp.]
MDKSIENKSGEVIKSEELDKSKVMLVFDYDGTIQETMKIYAPAILDIAKRLRTIYGVQVENPSYERMESWLGLRNDEMWAAFAPELPADARAAAAARVGAYMRMLVRDGADPWYAGARETLDKLKEQGYRMIILSNSDREYAEFNRRRFNTDKWFEKYIDCGSWDWQPKADVLSSIISDEPEMTYVMIGDRFNDQEAAVKNDILFIACDYGYAKSGELDEADARANSFVELSDIIARLTDC